MLSINHPKQWIRVKLPDVADLSMGQSPSSNDVNTAGRGIPFFQGKAEFGKLYPHVKKYCTAPKKVAQANDILLSVRAPVGPTNLAFQDTAIGRGLAAISVNSDSINYKFLLYYFRNIEPWMSEQGTGTTFKAISGKFLKELTCIIPPLAEQTVIANKLDTLLAQVESTKARLERIPEILKTFRQSVLEDAFNGKLTEEWRAHNPLISPINIKKILDFWSTKSEVSRRKVPKLKLHDTDSLGELPDYWQDTKLGHAFDVYVGATPSRGISEFWNGDVNWVSSSEVAFCRISSTKETITELGLASTSTNLHPPGTVLLAMIGQGKTRGQVAILDVDACHNQNTAALRIPEGFVVSEFLYFFLTKQYEETRRVGGGNNQKALNKSFVQSLAFPLPPIEEQREIVGRVEKLFSGADAIEKQVKQALKRINNLTQSILAKAFRGELTEQWRNENSGLISGENSAEALLKQITDERTAT